MYKVSGPLLEVYSFAHNTIFLDILKYGIPGTVLREEFFCQRLG